MATIYCGRRKITWKSVRGVKRLFAFSIATAMGAGLMPIAPGTMGTLIAIPIAYYTQEWAMVCRFLFWLGILGFGTWAAKVFDAMMGTSDNQNIVIDEVIGLGIASWIAGGNVKLWIASFILFRFFDTVKPPPVFFIDQWSKTQASSWLKAFGVILDDIVAGFQALGVVLVLKYFFFFK